MNIVVDVNVVLSALIKDAKTREILLTSGFAFYFPESSLHKIRKYKDYIVKKSGLREEDYLLAYGALFQHITLISLEELQKKWEEAKKIMEHIDPEDVNFVAAVLSIDDAVLWSDDTHFERQNTIRVLKMNDILKLLG